MAINTGFKTYTYYVKNTVTGQYYYGSRYANVIAKRTPAEDFWNHYTTSSERVNDLVKEYGKESFETKILLEDADYDKCYWLEQDLIVANINDDLCLNVTYVDRTTKTKKFSFAGNKHADITIQKISQSQTGENNSFYGKTHSDESNDKRRAWHMANKTDYTHSEESKQLISTKKLGKKLGPQTVEHKNKRAEALRGKIKKPHSEETKQKIKDSLAKTFAQRKNKE